MNTTSTIVRLLLPALCGGLAAQDLSLKATASPDQVQASVVGASAGRVVILVLGLREGSVPLPNGDLLGITPDLLAGFAIADGVNATSITVDLRLPLDPRITFYAQAVSVDLALPLDVQGIGVSQVRRIEVGKPR